MTTYEKQFVVAKTSNPTWDLGRWNPDRGSHSFDDGGTTIDPAYLPERGRFRWALYTVSVTVPGKQPEILRVGTERSVLRAPATLDERGGVTVLSLPADDWVVTVGDDDLEATVPGGVDPGDRVDATVTVEFDERRYLDHLDAIVRDRLRDVERSVVTFRTTVEGFEAPRWSDHSDEGSVARLAVEDPGTGDAPPGSQEWIHLDRELLPEDDPGTAFRCSLVHLAETRFEMPSSPYLAVARVEEVEGGPYCTTVELSDRFGDGTRCGTLQVDGDRLPTGLFEGDESWTLGIRLVPDR